MVFIYFYAPEEHMPARPGGIDKAFRFARELSVDYYL
jgi:hypothetical protein